MNRLLTGLTAAALSLACTFPAFAGPRQKNVIANSGNGSQNTVIAQNRGGFHPGNFHPGGFHPGQGVPFHPGQGFAQPGFAQPGFAQPVGYGGGYAQPGFAPPGIGGRSVNRITDSGNGVGNTIIARNRAGGGFAPYGGYDGGAGNFNYGSGFIPGFGGVNVNVITNSGNGAGNVIKAGNSSPIPGRVNVNVITNSGNGVGNYIKAGNR